MQIPPLAMKVALLAATVVMCASCSVSGDFKARLWEKCHIAAQKQMLKQEYSEARPVLEEAVHLAASFPNADDRPVLSMLLYGDCLKALNEPQKAAEIFRQAGERAKTAGASAIAEKRRHWNNLEGRALTGTADCYQKLNKLTEAQESYSRAIQTLKNTEIDPQAHGFDTTGHSLARAYEGLAEIYIQRDKVKDAVDPLLEAAKVADSTVASISTKENLRRRAISILWAAGRDEEAMAETGSEWAQAIDRCHADAAHGNVDSMRADAEQSEAYLFGQIDTPASRAVTNYYLAYAAYFNKNYDQAIDFAQSALDLRTKDGAPRVDMLAANLRQVLGLAQFAKGNFKEASANLKAACAVDSALGLPRPINTASRLAQLALAQFKLGETQEAHQTIERAERLVGTSGPRSGMKRGRAARLGVGMGIFNYWGARYYLLTGNPDEARSRCQDAIDMIASHKPNHIVAKMSKELLTELSTTKSESASPGSRITQSTI